MEKRSRNTLIIIIIIIITIIIIIIKMVLQWLLCQALGVIESAFGLVGPVSVYCDWVRRKV